MSTPAGTLPGADGTPVVLRAWCPTCEQEVMPHEATSECLWCQSPTISLDEHAARSAPFDPNAYWTRERIIDVIRAYHAEHGHPPTSPKWMAGPSTRERPNTSLVIKVFGKWTDAIRAAGFDPYWYANAPKLGLAEGERTQPPSSAREAEVAPEHTTGSDASSAQVGEPEIDRVVDSLGQHGEMFARLLAAHHRQLAERYDELAKELAA